MNRWLQWVLIGSGGLALVIIIAVLGMGWYASRQLDLAVDVGQSAPQLTFVQPGGETVTLADYRGQVVVLDFWATW
jgi:hypothetical protein